MGWSNYIIIPDWKMVIETNRSVNELEDYIKEALEKIIKEVTDLDLGDLKLSDITIKDLCTLSSAYENTSYLSELDTDKLFLYWLEWKDINYEIESEFNIKLEDYKDKGYKIIRIGNNIIEEEVKEKEEKEETYLSHED